MASGFSDLARGSARGSLVLMIGQIITVIISTITVIWVTRVLGSTDYGQYTVAFIPCSIALLFQDLGMNMSLTRFCAMYRHEGQGEKLKSVVMTGLLFSVVTSIIISVLIYAFAGPIATVFLKRPEVEPLVRAASFGILGGGGLVSTIQAIFVGYEIMNLRSLLQVTWTALRTVFSLFFILSGFGAFGAVLANTVSQVAAGLVGLLLLFIFVKFQRGSSGGFSFDTLNTFLRYGLPLSMSTLLNGVLAQIYNYIMILFVTTDIIGNYSAASNFGVLVSFFTVPISTTLFPLYSKFKRGDPRLKDIFQMAVKYTHLITLPVVLVIIVLSNQISRILYGANDYPYVPLYLSIFILNYVWEGLGGISLGNLISGVGESRVTLRASILTFLTGTTLAVLLVPRYGMAGLLLTIVLDARGGWVYQTLWVKRELNITVDWGSTLRIYLVGFMAFAASWLLVNLLTLHGWVAILSGGVFFLLVYAAGLPIIGALKNNDLRQLGTILDALGPIAPLARWALSLLGRITRD